MIRLRIINEICLACIVLLCAGAAWAQPYTWNVVQSSKHADKTRRVAIYQAKEDPSMLRLRTFGMDALKIKNHVMQWLTDNEACSAWCRPTMDDSWVCHEAYQPDQECVSRAGVGWTFYGTNFSQSKAYSEIFSKRNKCVFELDELTMCPAFQGPGCNLKNVAPPDCSYSEGRINQCLYRGVESYGCTSNKPNDGPLQCDECWTKEICSECLGNCEVYRDCRWCQETADSPWRCFAFSDEEQPEVYQCVETCQ